MKCVVSRLLTVAVAAAALGWNVASAAAAPSAPTSKDAPVSKDATAQSAAAAKDEPAKGDAAQAAPKQNAPAKDAPKKDAPKPDAPQAGRPASYWLGLRVESIGPSDALRTQLHLPDRSGVLVRDVVPDGPAAAAKIRPGDILLQADGRDIAGPIELSAWVESLQGRKAKLTLLRDGRRTEVEVTPAERPLVRLNAGPEEGRPFWDALRNALEKTPPGRSGIRLQYVHPGVIVKPGPDAPARAVPSGISISISRHNNHPASIAVSQGDQSWTTTEDKLDVLPNEIRELVAPMLAPGPAPRAGLEPPARHQRPLGPPESVLPPPQERVEKAAPRDLDALRREIRELRRDVEALRARVDEKSKAAENR